MSDSLKLLWLTMSLLSSRSYSLCHITQAVPLEIYVDQEEKVQKLANLEFSTKMLQDHAAKDFRKPLKLCGVCNIKSKMCGRYSFAILTKERECLVDDIL